MTAAGGRITPGFIAGAAGAAATVGAAALYQPALTLAALLVFAAGLALARWPEAAVLAVVALVWLNLPALGVREYDVPRTAGAIFPALLAFPVALRLVAGRRVEVDRPLVLLFVLLAVQLVGTALSAHVAQALDNTLTFAVEGVMIYALLLNSVARYDLLRRALWLILAAAALLSSVAIFQALTGNWLDDIGGLGQVNAGYLRNPDSTARAAGPIGDPNYFAQILLPAVAIGFVAFRREPRRARLAAAALGWLVVVGVLLTGSRGAFFALVFLLIGMIALRYARLRWLAALVLIVPLLTMIVPSYKERVESVTSAITGATQEKGSDTQADAATQGRVGEVRTASYVFLDHPVLGVGPGVFPLYYQEYAERHGIEAHSRSFVEEREGEEPPRQAHSMPVAIAADMGIVGLVLFTWLFAVVLLALARTRNIARRALSDAAGALLLAISSYLVAGLFLTLAFERYLWLLVALGGVAVALAGRSPKAERRKAAIRSS
jgi:O-antigen ligase